MCKQMPDDQELPPNKRVAEIMTKLSNEISEHYRHSDRNDIKNVKKFNFVLHKLAKQIAINEMLWDEINKIKGFLVLDE